METLTADKCYKLYIILTIIIIMILQVMYSVKNDKCVLHGGALERMFNGQFKCKDGLIK